MDIASIGSMLGSLNAAKNIGQAMLDMKVGSDVQAKVIELQSQILAAISSALDAKSECVRLLDENTDLKRDVKLLQEKIRTREEMIFESNACWKKADARREIPYCPKCLHGESERVVPMGSLNAYWHCPVCNFSAPNGQSQPEAARRRPYRPPSHRI